MKDDRFYIIKVNGEIRAIVSVYDYAPYLKELLQMPYACKMTIVINEISYDDLVQGKIVELY